MLEVGDRIGDHEIVARLKAGGMATLFLAQRKGAAGFQRFVAIKVVHSHLASDRTFVNMFLDEGRLSSRIVHPNVVHVEDLGEADGTYFLVMEYVHGCSLALLQRSLAKRRRMLAPDVAVSVVMKVADGLHAAHETRGDRGELLGVVHRDVSPQNVLIAYGGHVKLIDFGIAKARGRSQETEAGSIKGKFRYMSPEQAWGKEVDRRSDVFALGIVLWELLTGQPLFDAKSDVLILDQVRAPKITPPSKHAPGIPAGARCGRDERARGEPRRAARERGGLPAQALRGVPAGALGRRGPARGPDGLRDGRADGARPQRAAGECRAPARGLHAHVAPAVARREGPDVGDHAGHDDRAREAGRRSAEDDDARGRGDRPLGLRRERGRGRAVFARSGRTQRQARARARQEGRRRARRGDRHRRRGARRGRAGRRVRRRVRGRRNRGDACARDGHRARVARRRAAAARRRAAAARRRRASARAAAGRRSGRRCRTGGSRTRRARTPWTSRARPRKLGPRTDAGQLLTARLLTIPQSHYCEKARWALDRWAVPYVEEQHLPVFSRIATRRYGAKTVPVLVLDDGTVLRESSDILAYVDTQTAITPGPFPADGKTRDACKEWIRRFDESFGPATRVLAYDAIFRVPKLVRKLTDAQGPLLERKIGILSAPVVMTMISKYYRIDEASVRRSTAVVDETLREVADALADGRRYLCGDTFSAADITFASLAAVATCLHEYPFPLPDPSDLLPGDRDTVLRFRDTAGARFAERLYREERRGAK